MARLTAANPPRGLLALPIERRSPRLSLYGGLLEVEELFSSSRGSSSTRLARVSRSALSCSTCRVSSAVRASNASGSLLSGGPDTHRKDHTTGLCVSPWMQLLSKEFACDFRSFART